MLDRDSILFLHQEFSVMYSIKSTREIIYKECLVTIYLIMLWCINCVAILYLGFFCDRCVAYIPSIYPYIINYFNIEIRTKLLRALLFLYQPPVTHDYATPYPGAIKRRTCWRWPWKNTVVTTVSCCGMCTVDPCCVMRREVRPILLQRFLK